MTLKPSGKSAFCKHLVLLSINSVVPHVVLQINISVFSGGGCDFNKVLQYQLIFAEKFLSVFGLQSDNKGYSTCKYDLENVGEPSFTLCTTFAQLKICLMTCDVIVQLQLKFILHSRIRWWCIIAFITS